MSNFVPMASSGIGNCQLLASAGVGDHLLPISAGAGDSQLLASASAGEIYKLPTSVGVGDKSSRINGMSDPNRIHSTV